VLAEGRVVERGAPAVVLGGPHAVAA
jgi:hypothetical protein